MTNRVSRWIAWSAVGMGFLGDVLFNGLKIGINLPIALLAVLAVFEILIRLDHLPICLEARILMWSSAVFGVFIAWRDSATLTALNLMAIILIYVIVALRSRSGAFFHSPVTEYLMGVFPVAWQTLAGSLSVLRRDTLAIEPGERNSLALSFAVVRGILISIPLLFIFGTLFCLADAEFYSVVSKVFCWNIHDVLVNMWTSALYFMLAAGTLRALLIWDASLSEKNRPSWASIGAGEILTVIGMLNALFLAFVVVQFQFLFVSPTANHLSPGLSYTEYARSGFFELVWVTLLVLPTLLTFHWLLVEPMPLQLRLFQILTLTLVIQLFVIMLSAAYRMRLYIAAFGLTELRFYSSAFMVWLSIVFVWFLATVLRGQRDRFAFGGVVSAFGVIALLNVINPDAVIVRHNCTEQHLAPSVDSDYLDTLSADSAPALLRYISQSKGAANRSEIAKHLISAYGSANKADWREWNLSRTTARSLVSASLPALAKDVSAVPAVER